MKSLIIQAAEQVAKENPAGAIALGTGTGVSVWSVNEWLAIGGIIISAMTLVLFGINTWLRYHELAHAKANGNKNRDS